MTVECRIEVRRRPSIRSSRKKNSSILFFLINVSAVVSNGSSPGVAISGLYKDSTALIEKFSSIEATQWDAIPQSATYLDSAGSLTSRTYSVKIKGSEAGSQWWMNQNPTGVYTATSSMTILEIAY